MNEERCGVYGRRLTSLFSRCISAPLHVSAALFLHSLHSVFPQLRGLVGSLRTLHTTRRRRERGTSATRRARIKEPNGVRWERARSLSIRRFLSPSLTLHSSLLISLLVSHILRRRPPSSPPVGPRSHLRCRVAGGPRTGEDG